MIELFFTLKAYLWGFGGLGLGIAGLAAAAAFFLPGFRRLAIEVAVIAAVGSALYTAGVAKGRASYKAKIEREISDAVRKGDAARERALRDFDAAPDDSVPDDGFQRP